MPEPRENAPTNIGRAYQEIAELIAATCPEQIIAFRPSDGVQDRVDELVTRSKVDALSADEQAELDRFMQLEHLMRLAKARARQLIGQTTAA